MQVERSDPDGRLRVTLDASEAKLLAAALERASYQDIPAELQERTVLFAEDLLDLVQRAIRD